MAGLHGGRKAGTMVEGEQHVVNRRAIGHGGASLGQIRLARIPTKPQMSQLLGGRNSSVTGAGGPRISSEKAGPSSEELPYHKDTRIRVRFEGEFGPLTLLKWLNSVYRPAWPKGNPKTVYWGVAKW